MAQPPADAVIRRKRPFGVLAIAVLLLINARAERVPSDEHA